MKWTLQQLPPLAVKIAIVTGANSGLGYQVALALAGQNCYVILACRNDHKANAARDSILAVYPQAG